MQSFFSFKKGSLLFFFFLPIFLTASEIDIEQEKDCLATIIRTFLLEVPYATPQYLQEMYRDAESTIGLLRRNGVNSLNNKPNMTFEQTLFCMRDLIEQSKKRSTNVVHASQPEAAKNSSNIIESTHHLTANVQCKRVRFNEEVGVQKIPLAGQKKDRIGVFMDAFYHKNTNKEFVIIRIIPPWQESNIYYTEPLKDRGRYAIPIADKIVMERQRIYRRHSFVAFSKKISSIGPHKPIYMKNTASRENYF